MRRKMKVALLVSLALSCAVPGIALADVSNDDWGRWNVGEDEDWKNYSEDSMGLWSNDFHNGNTSLMSDEQIRATNAAIDQFKAKYITSDMNDFAKELIIIQWLVQNCSYEARSDCQNATAYSCIVNGKAQCSGYADAFLMAAKSCGLDVRYVRSDTHAWNMIKLDDDWYHVDVTWEDPSCATCNFGFGNLRNYYINLRDVDITKETKHHSVFYPDTLKALGTKYGPKAVNEYMNAHVNREAEAAEYFNSLINNDGATILMYSDVESTAQEYINYLKKCLDSRDEKFAIGIRYSKDINGDSVSKYHSEIKSKVMSYINSNYSSVLKSALPLYMPLRLDENKAYYCYDKDRINYKSDDSISSSNQDETKDLYPEMSKTRAYSKPTNVRWVTENGLGAAFDLDPAAEGGYSLYFEFADKDHKWISGTWTENTQKVNLWNKIFESGNYRFQVRAQNRDDSTKNSELSDWSPTYTYNKPSLSIGDVSNIRWADADAAILAWDAPANMSQIPAEYQSSIVYEIKIYIDGKVKYRFTSNTLQYDLKKWRDGADSSKTYTLTVQPLSKDIEHLAHGNEIRFK